MFHQILTLAHFGVALSHCPPALMPWPYELWSTPQVLKELRRRRRRRGGGRRYKEKMKTTKKKKKKQQKEKKKKQKENTFRISMDSSKQKLTMRRHFFPIAPFGIFIADTEPIVCPSIRVDSTVNTGLSNL